MTKEQFKNKAYRVWINNPSTLQPYHDLHGKVAIGVYDTYDEITVRVHFTEGPIMSMLIDPLHLDLKGYTE